jgi:hypothetical protein
MQQLVRLGHRDRAERGLACFGSALRRSLRHRRMSSSRMSPRCVRPKVGLRMIAQNLVASKFENQLSRDS